MDSKKDEVQSDKLKDFFVKQEALKEKFKSIWGEGVSDRAISKPKPNNFKRIKSDTKILCFGFNGSSCHNIATIDVTSTSRAHFTLRLCESCFKGSKFNVPAQELTLGIKVVKKQNDKFETIVGKLEEKLEIKKPALNLNAVSSPLSPDSKNEPKPHSAFLFNGQGAQAVGMTHSVQDLPAVKELYEKANRILGYDLRQLILSGSNETLMSTIHSQPAMLVAGLAAVEKLRAENPTAIAQCTATAGLSLGEYTALVFAGVLTVEDALALVKVRAEAMEEAAKQRRGRMLSVVGLTDKQIEDICSKVSEEAEEGQYCRVANLLFPGGRVLSGNDELLKKAEELATQAGATKVSKLHVSGAFHTPLMEPASNALRSALAKVKLSPARIPVYSNVTGKPFTNVDEIREGLASQLCSPVLWEQSLKQVIADGHRNLWELSPRAKALKAMVRSIDQKVWKNMKLVEV